MAGVCTPAGAAPSAAAECARQAPTSAGAAVPRYHAPRAFHFLALSPSADSAAAAASTSTPEQATPAECVQERMSTSRNDVEFIPPSPSGHVEVFNDVKTTSPSASAAAAVAGGTAAGAGRSKSKKCCMQCGEATKTWVEVNRMFFCKFCERVRSAHGGGLYDVRSSSAKKRSSPAGSAAGTDAHARKSHCNETQRSTKVSTNSERNKSIRYASPDRSAKPKPPNQPDCKRARDEQPKPAAAAVAADADADTNKCTAFSWCVGRSPARWRTAPG